MIAKEKNSESKKIFIQSVKKLPYTVEQFLHSGNIENVFRFTDCKKQHKNE